MTETSSQPQFDTLFALYYDRLIAWCRRRVGTGCEDPAELVHQTYLKCRNTWRDGRERSPDSHASYLFRALRWIMIDTVRRRQRRNAMELAVAVERRIKATDTPLGRLIAMEAIERMQGRPGRICLAILRGEDMRRICAEQQVTMKALAVYLCRARKYLRREFASR